MKPSVLFLRNGVPEKIIIFISTNNHNKETNYSKIARGICATYSATCKNMKILQDMGILEMFETERKNKQFKLTVKGEKIFKCIKEFDNI